MECLDSGVFRLAAQAPARVRQVPVEVHTLQVLPGQVAAIQEAILLHLVSQGLQILRDRPVQAAMGACILALGEAVTVEAVAIIQEAAVRIKVEASTAMAFSGLLRGVR